MSNSATPWTATCQAPPSLLSSRVCSNLCPSSQWCHPTISSSVPPSPFAFSLPASGSFSMSQLYPVIPMNIQGWSDLRFTLSGFPEMSIDTRMCIIVNRVKATQTFFGRFVYTGCSYDTILGGGLAKQEPSFVWASTCNSSGSSRLTGLDELASWLPSVRTIDIPSS